MNQNYYRPDIDGLRALAVVGVILFHANLSFPGGYVGVDVFFVISGYLITQIILRESNENRFSLKNFWIRRIKRIIPASLVVVITTFIVGYIILDAPDLASLGKSGVAYSLIAANIHFWRADGYFAEASDLQPLLHTWSLAVEEQFYLFFPLILSFLIRRKKRLMLIVLLLTGIASFILSSWGVYRFPSATFYLLPARVWELLAGGLLAIYGGHFQLKKPILELLSFMGIAAILCAMFLYTKATPFPGAAAVLPVGGTVLFIFANRNTQTALGRIFSLRPFVAIGLISYSLYLWHWPILVFIKHIFIEESFTVTFVGLVLTSILSYFSWRYIEIPFRNSKHLVKPSKAFLFGLISTGLTLVIGGLFWQLKGIPTRLNEHTLTILEDTKQKNRDYFSQSASGIIIGSEEAQDRPLDFVLWGDSHALGLTELIDALAIKNNLKGEALLTSGTPPVTGLWKPGIAANRQKISTELNRNRLDRILKSGVKNIILVARWDGMTEGLLESEIDVRKGKNQTYSMVTDSPSMELSPESSSAALKRQFVRMMKELSAENIKTWVMLQVPAASRSRVAKDFYLSKRFPIFHSKNFQLDTSKEEYEYSRRRSFQLFNEIKNDHLQIIDPINVFYSDNDRLHLYDTRSFYLDEDHLTSHGAEHYLESTFDTLLQEISLAKRN